VKQADELERAGVAATAPGERAADRGAEMAHIAELADHGPSGLVEVLGQGARAEVIASTTAWCSARFFGGRQKGV